MKYKIGFIVIFFVVLFNITFSSASSMSYKDPFLAGILSWMMPGTGQIYAQSYTKGSIFVLGDIIDKSIFIALILHLNNTYKKELVETVSWPALTLNDKALLLGYLFMSVSFKIYNSLDAVASAKKYNRIFDSKIGFSLTPTNCNLFYKFNI